MMLRFSERSVNGGIHIHSGIFDDSRKQNGPGL